MGILNIFLIAIGLSMDAFAVTIAKSLSINNIKNSEILKIAGAFGLFQGVMPLIGWVVGIKFQSYIMAFDHWVALILLTFIGGKMLFEALGDDKNAGEVAIAKSEDRIPIKTLLILSIATSIDALAVGVSLAFLNVSIIIASSIIAITTFILCIVAVYIGKLFGAVMEKRAEILGGVILIIIGVKIFLEHTL